MSAAIDRDTAELMQRIAGMETQVEDLGEKVDGLADYMHSHDKADVERHAELKADVAAMDGRIGRLHGKLDTFIARIDEREKAQKAAEAARAAAPPARPEWPGVGPALAAIPPQVWAWVLTFFGGIVAAWLATHGIDAGVPPVPLDVATTTDPE